MHPLDFSFKKKALFSEQNCRIFLVLVLYIALQTTILNTILDFNIIGHFKYRYIACRLHNTQHAIQLHNTI